jgi:hypothetical protein
MPEEAPVAQARPMYNPSYFYKIGIVPKGLATQAKESTDHVDQLIELIQNECTASFFRDTVQVKFPDLPLDMLGKDGWNCLHIAC